MDNATVVKYCGQEPSGPLAVCSEIVVGAIIMAAQHDNIITRLKGGN